MIDPIALITNRQEMHVSLDSIYMRRQRRSSLKAIVAFSSLKPSDLTAIAKEEPRLKKYKLRVETLDNNLFRISMSKEMLHEKVIEGQALIDVKDEAWVVLTTAKRYFTERAVQYLLDALYPEISRIYLNHHAMVRLLNLIRERYRGSKVLTQFAAEQEEVTKKGVSRKRIVVRGETAEEDLINISRKRRIWLQQITFEIESPSGPKLVEAVITSLGLSRLIFGNFTEYYDNVLDSALEVGQELNTKYNMVKRDITEERIVVNPCIVSYPSGFGKPHLQMLATKLSSQYTTAITHSGNPYFAAEILDPEDGSSFGLTLHGNEVTITPMLRSTRAALWRITARIQSILGEGSIRVP